MSTILVTGAAGLAGRALIAALAETSHHCVATDLHRPEDLPDGVAYHRLDVCGQDADQVIGAVRPDAVVHLASIVTPPKGSTRDMEYAVDVTGTENVLAACMRHGVRRLVVTSSGAAYGYHPENVRPLREEAPIRGNEAFAYSHHKRLIEERLQEARRSSPQLEQVVLRVGTILAPGLDNQITALFRKKRLLAISGTKGEFVFIWIDDLVAILLRAATDGPAGIYNVAGDGAMPIGRIAARLGRPVLSLPAGLLRAALRVARPLGLSRYGPEQVRFLQYRPVLDNTRLKRDFGYVPQHSSAEAFALWQGSVGL